MIASVKSVPVPQGEGEFRRDADRRRPSLMVIARFCDAAEAQSFLNAVHPNDESYALMSSGDHAALPFYVVHIRK